ncbi:TolB family protein [Niabella aquatica]
MKLSVSVLLGIAFCLYFPVRVTGQQFGGNRPSIQWLQIDSDTARIIFPEGLDSIARKVAGYVNRLAGQKRFSLGNKLNKIEIMLQNQPVITNGYVSQGPFRSEFYITPSADNYDPSSLSWPTQLTVHEYRHVQQYNNFNNGVSAVMKKLFGQEGYALAINAAVPNWFFEGDAVFSETALAPHGRGTLPFFLKAYPALWQSGKKYSWMKLRNGSLKDYVPNHYDLGYLLVNYGVNKYRYDFWRKVTHDASAYKGLFYPMQQAVKRHSGVNYKIFRDSAFNYYRNIYNLHTPQQQADSSNVFPVNKRTVTNYFYPYQVSKQNLLYLKSSYNQRPAFYIKTLGGEKRIRFRDISIDEQYGYNNGKIVYAAYESHPRWRWTSYSVIKLLDINTGKQKRLSSKTRYFTPDISPDGKTVAASHVALNGKSSLVLLRADNGKVIKEIRKETVAYFSSPKITDDSTVITVLRNKDATTNIAKINIYTGDIENLTPPSFTIIGAIYVKADKVYFSASQHLKDELFYYDIRNKRLFHMKTSGVGSYFVNNDFDKTTWGIFTADGYQLQQAGSGFADWRPYPMQQLIQSKTGVIADSLVTKENIINTPSGMYKVKSYSKLTHPVNFHSWRPNYSDPEFSFTLYGNNILNTTETQLYYIYNENDKTHTAGGNMVYGGLFPYITVGSEYTFNRKSVISQKIKEWNEWNSYVGINIPLSWTGNRTYQSFNIGSNYFYRTDFNKGPDKNNFNTLKFSYLTHRISWAQQVQAMTQDIYPRLGYSANAQFRHALNYNKIWQSYAGLNVYLPGIFPAHSVVLNGAFQYSGNSDRVFGNRTAFARGYAARDSAGVYTARANYHFPVAYPDWGFANIFYLQRVRGNLFYDYVVASNKKATEKTALQSAGAEVYFDTKWWNQHPLTLGFRAGYLLTPLPGDQRKLFFEFLLPTGLIPR